MEINIECPHFAPREPLKNFVHEKLGRLPHLYARIEAAEVILKLDKSNVAANKICEIRLLVPGDDLFAERQEETFEQAIMNTVDALQKQIEKRKTKWEDH